MLMAHKKLAMKVKLSFNPPIQSTLVQSVAILQVLMVPRKLVMRVKHGFNLPLQNIPAQSVPTAHKKSVTRAKL